MPELPEVETVKNGLNEHLCDKRIKAVTIFQPLLRYRISDWLTQKLHGSTLRTIERRGKYLLFYLDTTSIIAHLGMTGAFHLDSPPYPACGPHDHLIMEFSDLRLRYNDMRRFGFLLDGNKDPHQHPMLATLGMEPLEDTFTGAMLYRHCQTTRRMIKTVLMDSRIVVGVGNIYANEVLFECGIHPATLAKHLSLALCDQLVENIKAMLYKAIAQGGSTIRNFTNTSGQPGYFTQTLNVYQKNGEPCPACNHPIKKQVINQRSAFFCPHCQISPGENTSG